MNPARLSTRHADGVAAEKRWYLEELHFDFQGRVDNRDYPDKILFRVTSAEPDTTMERRLNQQLKYNGKLDLLLYGKDGRMDLMIEDPHYYVHGDACA